MDPNVLERISHFNAQVEYLDLELKYEVAKPVHVWRIRKGMYNESLMALEEWPLYAMILWMAILSISTIVPCTIFPHLTNPWFFYTMTKLELASIQFIWLLMDASPHLEIVANSPKTIETFRVLFSLFPLRDNLAISLNLLLSEKKQGKAKPNCNKSKMLRPQNLWSLSRWSPKATRLHHLEEGGTKRHNKSCLFM